MFSAISAHSARIRSCIRTRLRRRRRQRPRRLAPLLLLLLPGALLCPGAAARAAPADGRYHCTVLQHSALYERIFVLKEGAQDYLFDQAEDAIHRHRDENLYVETYRKKYMSSRTRWYEIYVFDLRSRMLMLAKVEYGPPREYEEAKDMMVSNTRRLQKKNPQHYEALEALGDRFREGGAGHRHDRPDLYYHRPDLYRWIPQPLPEGYRAWGWGDGFWQCNPVSALEYFYLAVRLLFIVLISSA
ncbi:MAG: hypothetical protein OXU43_00045 [Gammaproteobacteria bacterium]|nr:hypothetical protein [Gammaproteobacteria bacterium]